MKKLLLLLLIVLTGCGSQLVGGSLEDEIYNEKIRQIETDLLDTEKTTHLSDGKYIEIKKSKEIDGTEYKVDHIVVWDGKETPKSDGYQVYIKRKDGKIKSYGEGEMSIILNHDWVNEEIISTSTQ